MIPSKITIEYPNGEISGEDMIEFDKKVEKAMESIGYKSYGAGCDLNKGVRDIVFEPIKEDDATKPEDCKTEYDETVCGGCEWLNSESVGHPGGDGSAVDKRECELGFWADDF